MKWLIQLVFLHYPALSPLNHQCLSSQGLCIPFCVSSLPKLYLQAFFVGNSKPDVLFFPLIPSYGNNHKSICFLSCFPVLQSSRLQGYERHGVRICFLICWQTVIRFYLMHKLSEQLPNIGQVWQGLKTLIYYRFQKLLLLLKLC